MIYLNHAATSWPKPPGVVEAMTAALAAPPAHPGRAANAGEDVAGACRAGLSRLLDVSDPRRIILTTNATHSLNLAIHGVRLERGARVVTTAAEHNSVLRPLRAREVRDGIRVVVVPARRDGSVDEGDMVSAIDAGARLVAMTHASNVTGAVSPVAPVFAHARRAGAVTLLDASQTAGHLDVCAGALGADLVVMTGHKALGGPPGTGALYVADGLDLDQWLVGGTGVRSELLDHPGDMPIRLEAGTPNTPAMAAFAAALDGLAGRFEGDRIRLAGLTERLHAGLGAIPGVQRCGPSRPSDVGIVSFRMAGWDVEEAAFILEGSFGIACRSGLHCAPLIHQCLGTAPHGTIRFSLGATNTEDEIEAAIEAVGRLAA